MTAFLCEFCKKEYTKEIFLINHNCKKKRWWFEKDKPDSRIAFMAWNRFHELNGKKHQTFREFIDSQFYLAFIRFGKQVLALNVFEPAKFIDYVIKNNLPLHQWTHDFVYEQFIREFTKQEPFDNAFERGIVLMKTWSDDTGEPWYDFFRKVNPNQATNWIRNGKLSPWVLYNVDSSTELLNRCNEEQINIITKYAPSGPWKIKFNKDKEGCKFIRETLQNNGM